VNAWERSRNIPMFPGGVIPAIAFSGRWIGMPPADKSLGAGSFRIVNYNGPFAAGSAVGRLRSTGSRDESANLGPSLRVVQGLG
jgi:hypothetical protein